MPIWPVSYTHLTVDKHGGMSSKNTTIVHSVNSLAAEQGVITVKREGSELGPTSSAIVLQPSMIACMANVQLAYVLPAFPAFPTFRRGSSNGRKYPSRHWRTQRPKDVYKRQTVSSSTTSVSGSPCCILFISTAPRRSSSAST